MSRYNFGPQGPPHYVGPYDNRTSRKRNPSYEWKKSPTNVSKSTQKSGKYDHTVIEKEILRSSQLNTKENKLDDIYKNNPSMVIKKGVYYHHDRKSRNINNNNNNNNNNRKDKENININRNVTLVRNTDELKKLKMMRLPNYNQNERKIYSNEFERDLIQSRQTRKKKQVIPPPYPPNYPINTKNNANLYQQPYIDSPSLQGRRRQQRIQSRQKTQQQYYRSNYNTQLPTTPTHTLMQLRYEADNAASTTQVLFEKEYQSRNKYGAYLADGLWYPFPETQLRLNNETETKKKSKKKDDEKKVDNTRKGTTNASTEKYINNITTDYTEVGLTPGQKINRMQNQLEYYFSEGNLCNDIHLRSLLDKEGWVSAKNIENFPRMSKYGAKAEMIIEAAYHSNFIEVKDNKYIRMKVGWEQFVSKNNKINIDKDKTKNKVIDIDLKNIPDNINDNNNNAVSKKEIKNIVKFIQLKDKKHKERQKKKKDKKSTKKDDSKKDKDNDNDNNNKKDNSNKNDNNINRKDDDGLQTALQELNSDNKKSKDKSTKSDDDQSAIDVD